MTEPQIVYKRNSAWWFATCYLLGTLFLLLWAAISLLGLAVDVGKEGVMALQDASKEQEVNRALSSFIKDDIKLTGFNVVSKLDRATLSLSIRNDSKYAIEKVMVEIAHIDKNGLPLHTRDEWLSDIRTIFPDDTAHSQVSFALRQDYSGSDYAVRISRFDVVGDTILKEICGSQQVP